MTLHPSDERGKVPSRERETSQGSEVEVSIILAELSRNDSILQSYRDQFLVAETFTAAIAASALLTAPNIAIFVSLLGIPMLLGWIVVVWQQAKAYDYWSNRLAKLEYFREYFQIFGKRGYSWARVWLGGGPGRLTIGILQWVFALFWLVVIVNALILR